MSHHESVLHKKPESFMDSAKIKTRPRESYKKTKGVVEALVLTCMDHRLVNDVAHYMDRRGLRDRYDQITLAGAAIGVLSQYESTWGNTFWEHVDLARELHSIKKIIVIDHEDCGVCKKLLHTACTFNKPEELRIHTRWMQALARNVSNYDPALEVELLYMHLDGSVERVETYPSSDNKSAKSNFQKVSPQV